jgi:hypothetical protein
VIGDPDRSWLYAWEYDGIAIPDRVQVAASEEWYDQQYHGGWRLPADARPGPLELSWADATVQVVAPPKRKLSDPIAPNESSYKNAVREVARGCTVLRLAAGEHVWEQPLRNTGPLEVRGYGSTLRPGNKDQYLFQVAGPDLGLYGLTIIYDRLDPREESAAVLHADPGQVGLVVADCTLHRCNLGFWFGGALVRDTVFQAGGCVIAPAGAYVRVKFKGPSLQHAFQSDRTWGPRCRIDCFFDATDRGVCVNTNAGPVSDDLDVSTFCRDICRSINGNEIFLVEGPNPLTREQQFHTRIVGCQGGVLLGMRADVRVRDLFIDGGAGLQIGYGPPGTTAERVTVEDGEFRNGAGAVTSPSSRNCTLDRFEVYNWSPGRNNADYYNPLERGTVAVNNAGGETNTVANYTIVGTAAGCEDVRGFDHVPRAATTQAPSGE